MTNSLTPIDPSKFLPSENSELETDLNYVRKNQYDLIEKGVEGLDGIMKVADASQHPRAYEVLSTYLKTLSELNKDLVQTAVQKNEKKIARDEPDSNRNVTNQLFVGSTAQLAEMLKQAKLKDE